jgi:hypothetical protein
MWVFSPLPLSLVQLSPTMNFYGVLAGADKMGHFFQQGHEYYVMERDGERDGIPAQQVRAEIIAKGAKQESGGFGTAIDGVYSNADLAANMAGMQFYESLTRSVTVGNRTVGPMLLRRDGQWELAADLDPDRLLEPFISEHLNEALNPSRYAFNRRLIRKAVSERCPEWRKQYPGITREVSAARIKELSTWYGEDYGHWLPEEEAITLASECQ